MREREREREKVMPDKTRDWVRADGVGVKFPIFAVNCCCLPLSFRRRGKSAEKKGKNAFKKGKNA